MKVINIENCKECPHSYMEGEIAYCKLANRVLGMPCFGILEIPNWCSLQNAKME